MKTLDRYIAGLFIRNFLLGVLSLTALFIFQQLLGQMFEREFANDQILIYNLLYIPQTLVQMVPPSVLLATVFTLSGLGRSNELVACYSIGVGVKRLTALLVSLVIMISCLVLVFEDRILPPSYRHRTTYYWREMKQHPDFFLDVKQAKIWYRSRNLIYNLQRFDTKTRTIHGMSVYTFDDNFNLIQVIDAQRAEYSAASDTDTADSSKAWRLLDGTVTVFSKENSFPLTQKFAEKELILAETPKDFQEIDKEVEGLRLKELYKYIQKMKSAGADTKGYEVKLHSKISLSFIPVVMCFLGIPFSLRGRREGGVAKDAGLCLLVTFFYWLFYSVGLSLGTNGALPPWLAAWLPSSIFAAAALTLIARQRTA